MALVEGEQVAAPWRGLVGLPFLRQVGLLVGLAGAVALGVAVVMWSTEPNYSVLGANMPDRVKPEVMTALQGANILYKLDASTGQIMVPSEDLARARMQIASFGSVLLDDSGFEMLNEEQSFGMSARLEQARLQRALEGELGRSIRSLRSVETARVHLALPQRSAFVRDKTPASASVVVRLFPGRRLDSSRVVGIQELVSAAVPELMSEDVAVLDDQGRLLSISEDENDSASSGHYLAMTREVEKTLNDRIHELLEPMFGTYGVRARVSAELDFSQVETTRENYNPQQRTDPLIRSEELVESDSGAVAETQGVPGALTNEPPQGGELSAAENTAGGPAPDDAPLRSRTRSQVVRNYELDRLIEHVKSSPGRVARLSVAVLLDRDMIQESLPLPEDEFAADPGAEPEPDTTVPAEGVVDPVDERLADIERLVREAVGLQDSRGDSIEISAVAFQPRDEQVVELPDPPFWEKPWLWQVLRMLGGGAVVLVLLLSVVRPTLRVLARPPALAAPVDLPGADSLPERMLEGRGANPTQQRLQQARDIVSQDPRRVAQLTRAWLSGDE